MQYTVPKFIEHKVKIVGPLTIRQFIFIGGAAAICFIFHFLLPFFLFIFLSVIVMLIGGGLAFGKVGGRSLSEVLKNMFSFSLGPKVYLWKKKTGMPPILQEERIRPELKKEVSEKMPVPTAAAKSRLKDLSTQVETGAK